MHPVGIIGASGYGGAELLRLLAGHAELEVRWATGDSQAGNRAADLYPGLAGAYGDLRFSSYEPDACEGLELVFLALPHGASQALVPELRRRVPFVVDLAADFRLRDPALYPTWYGEEHAVPELLGEFAYGLVELFRDEVKGASAVAVPGCYPTAATLALAPLVRAGLVEPTGIVVDAATGVSGGGRGKFPFGETDHDFRAYGLLDHRHTPEIEQAIGGQVLFTPHLAPMSRGILATCYARPTGATSTDELLQCFRDTYVGEPFITVRDDSPNTKATLGTNSAHLGARHDPRTGWVIALAAIDNLGKGAAGQAIQCANLLLGLPEERGLTTVGLHP